MKSFLQPLILEILKFHVVFLPFSLQKKTRVKGREQYDKFNGMQQRTMEEVEGSDGGRERIFTS